jgi:hypothetical protein
LPWPIISDWRREEDRGAHDRRVPHTPLLRVGSLTWICRELKLDQSSLGQTLLFRRTRNCSTSNPLGNWGELGTDGTFSGFSFGLSIASRQGWRFTGRAKIAENVPSVPEIPVPEIPRISSAFVVQALFAKQLPCGLLAGGNLRIARVKITPYDQHRSAPFLRASVVSATKLTRS